MDHQWRQRPVQNSICPVCSVPHFPFCPPPPSFGPNPSFTPPPGHRRPGFDLYSPHPWRGPANGVRDPWNWHGYPNPGVEPYGQVPIRPHSENFLPAPHPGGSNGFFGDAERNYKRMRVEGRVLSEDERRLKLVRDHGGGNSGYAPEVDSVPGDASSSGAKLATGEKETSRSGVDTKISLHGTDLSPSSGSWSENPGMKPLSYEHRSGMSRANFVLNYPLLHPQRVSFPGNDVKQPFDGTQDPSGYRRLPGTTHYAAPSFKIHSSPPPPKINSSLFPVPVNSSETPLHYTSAHETFPVQSYHHYSNQLPDAPNGFINGVFFYCFVLCCILFLSSSLHLKVF